MKRLLRICGGLVCLAAFGFACSGGDDRADRLPDDGGIIRPGPEVGPPPEAGPDAPIDDGGFNNCGDVICPGASSCVVDPMGVASCECDFGFVQNPDVDPRDATDCIVDESCANIRFLENGLTANIGCRVVLNGTNAVGLFFAADTCAGTAILPDRLGPNLEDAFEILEDGVPVRNNPEASSTIIERDIESYVTIVVDVSESLISQGQLVSQLTAELRDFVQTVRTPPGEPPLTASVVVFGRTVEVLQPFTKDLAKVDAALAQIETAPGVVQAMVGGDGTSLFAAVKRGIQELDRIQGFRRVVTDSGVLTSGTLVVVTDGKDTSGDTIDQLQIDETRNNMISIGISPEISNDELTAIGRDGSFLAPRPEDWEAAFDEIARRVDEHPDRAYLLGYCSSATTGLREVSVGLADMGTGPGQFSEVNTATCRFNAEFFSPNPAVACNPAFFQNECNGKSCGGLLACGSCADTECCAGNQCEGPGAVQAPFDCNAQNELCPPGQVCVLPAMATVHICVDPQPIGAGCDEEIEACAPGESICTFSPVDAGPTSRCLTDDMNGVDQMFAEGESCADPFNAPLSFLNCETLNCQRENPDSPASPLRCVPGPVPMFGLCAGTAASGFCETGTKCSSPFCVLRGPPGFFTCTEDVECASGHCDMASQLCVDTGACHYNWASKLD